MADITVTLNSNFSKYKTAVGSSFTVQVNGASSTTQVDPPNFLNQDSASANAQGILYTFTVPNNASYKGKSGTLSFTQAPVAAGAGKEMGRPGDWGGDKMSSGTIDVSS